MFRKSCAIVLLLAACAGTRCDAGVPARIPLRVWFVPSPRDASALNQVYLAVVEEFKRRNPDIELLSFSGVGIQGQPMDSQTLLSIAGGTAPDVLYVDFRQSDTYIQQSFLYPLDEFIARDMAPEELESRVPPPVRPVAWRQGPGVGGLPAGVHWWCLPFEVMARALFYRKDMFEEAGLDGPPQDWRQLHDFARRLSDPARGRYALAIGQTPAWDFTPYVWSAGGDIVAQGPEGRWSAAFSSPEGAAALDFFVTLATERWRDADGGIQIGYCHRGGDLRGAPVKVAMSAGYLNEMAVPYGVSPSLLGVAPFPKGPGGCRASEVNAMMLGIFAGAEGRKDSSGAFVPAARVREAAWRYIHFIDCEEARRIRVGRMVALGMASLVNPTALRRYGHGEHATGASPEWEEVYRQAMRDGKPEPYGKNCQMVYEYLDGPVNEAIAMGRLQRLPKDPAARREALAGLLLQAAARVDERMLGILPPETLRLRRAAAAAAAAVLAALFLSLFGMAWRSLAPPRPAAPSSGRPAGARRARMRWLAYALLAPAAASILFWTHLPMAIGGAMAFFDVKICGGSAFAGLDNFAEILFRPEWWRALWNTARYMLALLLLGFPAPFLLAILLQEASHLKTFYRLAYYLPALFNGLVVVHMWKLFFQGDSAGMLNQAVAGAAALFGIEAAPVAWLEDPGWALLACAAPAVWAAAGPGCLVYLAALRTIPEQLYEAAEIDGASFAGKLAHVVIPAMGPLLALNFIGAFLAAAENTAGILILTYGHADTEVAGLSIFKEAYMRLRFGSAAAMACMLGLMLAGLAIVQLRRLSALGAKRQAT